MNAINQGHGAEIAPQPKFAWSFLAHFGMDEEHRPTYQKYNRLLVMRQGELWIFKALSDGGYDVVPCSSHCYGGDAGFLKSAEWCKANMDPEHFIGYQMAPWMQTGEAYRRLLFKGSALLAEAKRKIG